MNDNYTNPELEDFEDDEEGGLDILAIFARILKRWKLIAAIGILFGMCGVVDAIFFTTKEYVVKATVAPEFQRVGGGSLSSIASMLGMGNANMNASVDAINVSIFPQICRSIPFITNLFDMEIHTYVSPSDSAAGIKPETTTLFDHVAGKDKPLSKRQQKKLEKAIEEGYDPEREYKVDPTHLTNLQRGVYSKLSTSIVAAVDNKTGFTSVTVTMDDPEYATQVADSVVRRLQEYVIDYRTQKAQRDLDYYTSLAEEAKEKMIKAQAAYAASVDYNRSVILQTVNSQKERLRNEANLAQTLYSQMEQQKELARAKVQEMKPVFVVVQPASKPKESITSRKKIVLIWGFIGGFLACAWFGLGESLALTLIEGIRKKMDEEESEESKEA